eukprot:NODE_66_length_23959_cov_0.323009.p3 type:complete len:393 gc:universal NODE_66_length_23959_cov_0.323009:12634-11456(-)
MLEILIGLLVKILFDFSCVGYFLSKNDSAFIQVRMPTLTLILVAFGSLYNIFDVFLNMDGPPVFGCVAYGFAYSYLTMAMMVTYMIMVCRFFNLANPKQTKESEILTKICFLLSSMPKDGFFWDQPAMMKKLKRKKICIFMAMIFIPGTFCFLIYVLISGPALHNSTGIDGCKAWANSVTYLFLIIFYIFTFELIRNIDYSNDIFKTKKYLYATFGANCLYCIIFTISIISHAITGKNSPRVYMNIANSICIAMATIYPVYLSKQIVKNDLNITSIIRNKNLWNRFKVICTESLSGQYVSYIEDFKMLDQGKPLQVQRFMKKYFDWDSPCYLEIATWNLDLSNPDHYTLITIERSVVYYLQTNFVVYLDSHSLDLDLDSVKLHTYSRKPRKN